MYTTLYMCILYCFKLHVHVPTCTGTVATALTCSWHSIVPCLYSTLIGVFRSKDLVVSCMDGFNVYILLIWGDVHNVLHDNYEKAVYAVYTCIYCKLMFIVQYMYMYMYMYVVHVYMYIVHVHVHAVLKQCRL